MHSPEVERKMASLGSFTAAHHSHRRALSCDDVPGSLAVSLGHILSSVLMLGSVEVQRASFACDWGPSDGAAESSA